MIAALSRATWIRCFIVSAAFAVVAPFISSVSLMPSEGEQVIELKAIEARQLKVTSVEDALSHLDSVPTRTLSRFERFTYQFTHPQYWLFYLRGVAASFIWLFLATLSVSYLNLRKGK